MEGSGLEYPSADPSEDPKVLEAALVPDAKLVRAGGKEEVLDRIRGLVFGQAIGDALGLATEFMSPEEAKMHYGEEGEKLSYSNIVQDGHRKRWKIGDWTDDTDQMICLLDSLCCSSGIAAPTDFALRLKVWVDKGFRELGDSTGMGIGQTVISVVESQRFLKVPRTTAKKVWEEGGKRGAANGGTMRTSVAGVPFFWDLTRVADNAARMCEVTHADPRCVASCVAVSSAVALILAGSCRRRPKGVVRHALGLAEIRVKGEHLTELQKFGNAATLEEMELGGPEGIGYCYRAMGAGLWALQHYEGDFEGTIKKIIMQAGDADSNAAVAGALMGVHLGFKKLPKHLITQLRYVSWLERRVEQLSLLLGLI